MSSDVVAYSACHARIGSDLLQSDRISRSSSDLTRNEWTHDYNLDLERLRFRAKPEPSNAIVRFESDLPGANDQHTRMTNTACLPIASIDAEHKSRNLSPSLAASDLCFASPSLVCPMCELLELPTEIIELILEFAITKGTLPQMLRKCLRLTVSRAGLAWPPARNLHALRLVNKRISHLITSLGQHGVTGAFELTQFTKGENPLLDFFRSSFVRSSSKIALRIQNRGERESAPATYNAVLRCTKYLRSEFRKKAKDTASRAFANVDCIELDGFAGALLGPYIANLASKITTMTVTTEASASHDIWSMDHLCPFLDRASYTAVTRSLPARRVDVLHFRNLGDKQKWIGWILKAWNFQLTELQFTLLDYPTGWMRVDAGIASISRSASFRRLTIQGYLCIADREAVERLRKTWEGREIEIVASYGATGQ